MITVFSEDHRFQDGKFELIDGKLVPPFENPRRAAMIVARVREMKLGDGDLACGQLILSPGAKGGLHSPAAPR